MSASAAAIATSRILRRQRELAERFAAAGATTPERAVRLTDVGVEPGAAFDRLVRGGVVVRADGDRWFLSRTMWDRFTSRQRTRLFVAAMVIILGATAFMALWLAL